jgi:aryl-alcohol dehydrogenase
VYPTPLPAVLGHEGAGVVETVSTAVKTVKSGDHVVLATAYCTHCVQCRSGRGAYCENLFAQDFGGRREDGTTSLADADGDAISSHFFGQSSFGTYANVVESSLVKVPESAPLEMLAPLGCGLNTGAGSVLGPLEEQLLAITDGRGVDYILDTTAVPSVLSAAAKALGIRGTLALVGAAAPGTEVSFEIGLSLVKGWTFKTIIQGSSVTQQFIPRLVELWSQGLFPFDKLIKSYTLDQINEAFADSESGRVVKPVVVY